MEIYTGEGVYTGVPRVLAGENGFGRTLHQGYASEISFMLTGRNTHCLRPFDAPVDGPWACGLPRDPTRGLNYDTGPLNSKFERTARRAVSGSLR